MGIRRILLDEHLLIDLLFMRSRRTGHGDLLWDLFVQGRMEGCVTDFGLEKIWHYTSRLRDKATANALLRRLYRVLSCCPIQPSMLEAAEHSDLALPFAIQMAVAIQLDLDGIVTDRPFTYYRCMDFAEVQIYTPGHLLAEFLQGSLEDQRRGLEARYTQPALMEAGQVTTIGLRLEQIEVCCGNERPTATIQVQSPLGRTYQQTASGVGPVDATFRAINLAIGRFMPMSDIQMIYYKSLGTSADSEVSAMVLLQRRMTLFPGRGFHPDIVMASAYAYIDALNYLLYCEAP